MEQYTIIFKHNIPQYIDFERYGIREAYFKYHFSLSVYKNDKMIVDRISYFEAQYNVEDADVFYVSEVRKNDIINTPFNLDSYNQTTIVPILEYQVNKTPDEIQEILFDKIREFYIIALKPTVFRNFADYFTSYTDSCIEDPEYKGFSY
jgi:hypothetical protein